MLEEIDQRAAEHGADLPWCATLIVELEASFGRLVVAHHKPNWPFPLEAEREQQALRAALAVERYAAQGPAVVLGDFDATPDAAGVLFWRGRRSLYGVSVCYQDAWETLHPTEPGLTFRPRTPGQGRGGRHRNLSPHRLRARDCRATRSVAPNSAL